MQFVEHSTAGRHHSTALQQSLARAAQGLTPGITRRAFNLETIQANDESRAIRGPVHAVIGGRGSVLFLICGQPDDSCLRLGGELEHDPRA